MLIKTTDACRIQMSLGLGERNQVVRFAEHAFPRDRVFVL